jgi:hypothetical protein
MYFDNWDFKINSDDHWLQYVPWLVFGGWYSDGFPMVGWWTEGWKYPK